MSWRRMSFEPSFYTAARSSFSAMGGQAARSSSASRRNRPVSRSPVSVAARRRSWSITSAAVCALKASISLRRERRWCQVLSATARAVVRVPLAGANGDSPLLEQEIQRVLAVGEGSGAERAPAESLGVIGGIKGSAELVGPIEAQVVPDRRDVGLGVVGEQALLGHPGRPDEVGADSIAQHRRQQRIELTRVSQPLQRDDHRHRDRLLRASTLASASRRLARSSASESDTKAGALRRSWSTRTGAPRRSSSLSTHGCRR